MMNLRIIILILGLFQIYYVTTSFAKEPPQQGTIIQCEECVVLYPEKYQESPESCPVCHGIKEHFQPARMMDNELAAVEAQELEYRIENFLIQTIKDSCQSTVTIETLKDIRGLYMQKLRFNMIYNQFELEPIREYILELDKLIK